MVSGIASSIDVVDGVQRISDGDAVGGVRGGRMHRLRVRQSTAGRCEWVASTRVVCRRVGAGWCKLKTRGIELGRLGLGMMHEAVGDGQFWSFCTHLSRCSTRRFG
eukprot:4312765-Prymnesium_polylepis.1